MSNRSTPEESGTSTQRPATPTNDWTLCILCQKKTSEPLQYPGKSKRPNIGSGYTTLSKNLDRFKELGSIPLQLNVSRLDDGEGIEHCLKSNNALWHKSCFWKFNNTMVNRAEKKRQATLLSSEASSTKYIRKHDTVSSTLSCFFCEKSGKSTDLRSAATFQLDFKVRTCALQIQDQKLLAKLSSGDLIAQEAKYHPACLVDLYRKAQSQNKEKCGTELSEENIRQGIVFAELIEFIEECKEADRLVFRLADLTALYVDRLENFGIKSQNRVHSTRLKNKLLAYFHDLRAYQEGRDVFLAFDKQFIGVLKDACVECYDTEAMHLAKAAKIIRRGIFNMHSGFDGSFDDDCQAKSIPPSLLALVSMILEGPNIKSHGSTNQQSELTIAQLLKFNSRKRPKEAPGLTRHSKDNETPLPLYLGLMIHAKTRRRDLIDTLFELGLSVSYDRVLQVSTDLANKACSRFEAEHVVCPANLRSGLFTTSAIDNIDHNPSATSAHDSFHGTGIFLFQHPTTDYEGVSREP